MQRHRSLLLYTLLSMLVFTGLAQTPPFPLKESANHRYLVDRNQKPFPILGRTAWFLISQSEAEYKFFVEDCLKYGYNAIEMHVVDHDPRGAHPPYNGAGELPFLKRLDGKSWEGKLVYGSAREEAPDMTKPNERFWVFVDGFLNYCRSKGIIVFMFPVYVGYPGTDQGWMRELEANGPARAEAFGAWIASRYKKQDNLVWMLLGDRSELNTTQHTAEAALIKGLKTVPGQLSPHYSAECESDQCSACHPDFGKEMTLNGAYSWAHVVRSAHEAYEHVPVMPSFLLEEPYDEEGPEGNKINPYATQPVRRYQWWGWLGTIGGYISGNGYVWPFREGVWKQHLATPNTEDMMHLNEFIRAHKWWTLVPGGSSRMKDLVLSNQNDLNDTTHVAAAASISGDLLIAYIPPVNSGSVTVDMSMLKGDIRGRWFDPSSGEYLIVAESGLTSKQSKVFALPGKNKRGGQDWVLELTITRR